MLACNCDKYPKLKAKGCQNELLKIYLCYLWNTHKTKVTELIKTKCQENAKQYFTKDKLMIWKKAKLKMKQVTY